jgi:hypothetical protein
MAGQWIPGNCRRLHYRGLPAVIFLFLGFWTLAGGNGSTPTSTFSARVGQSIITYADIGYFISVQEAYGDSGITDASALVALVNLNLEKEVGRLFDVYVTDEEISALSEHADTSSRAPEVLSSIKQVFGTDRQAYERIYLSPKIMNWKLRYWYSRNERIHQHERKRIEQAWALASTGKTIEEAARESGLEYGAIGDVQADPMPEILDTLADGELYSNIVEDEFGYRVIKRVGKDDHGYSYEQIVLGKRPFEQWFAEQATGIPVSIPDKNIKGRIIRTYPNLTWTRD